MAPQKKVRKGKKKWCEVLASKEFNNAVIGESYVYDPEDLMGTKAKANLMTLTNDIKKQSMSIVFKVTEVKEGKVLTQPLGYYILPTMIKRIVRRGRDKVEDSFLVKTKDGKYARIKPMVITTNNCERRTQSSLRKKVRIVLRKYATQRMFNEIIMDIVNQSIQKTIKSECKLLYPLRNVTIRTFEEVHLRHEVEIPIDSDDIIVRDEEVIEEEENVVTSAPEESAEEEEPQEDAKEEKKEE